MTAMRPEEVHDRWLAPRLRRLGAADTSEFGASPAFVEDTQAFPPDNFGAPAS